MIAFYDLDIAPVSYDIVQFLVAAQHAANGDPLHVVIVPGTRDGWRRDDHKPISDAERDWRVDHVLIASCRRAGVTVTLAPSRSFAKCFAVPGCFPFGYTVEKPKAKYRLSNAMLALNTGFVPSFRASDRAREHVARIWGSGFVTVTLRNTHTPSRNSSPDWLDVAAQISARHDVIVIPDTADIGTHGLGRASDLLALDLDLRLAAYEAASLNLSASGGPFCLAMFLGLPYLWWHESAKEPDGPDFHAIPEFMAHHLLPMGSQFPGHGQDNRRILWEPDTFDNIMAAFQAATEQRVAA